MHPFRYLLRVRYAECDAQGIAFNARWAEWVDLATTELLRAALDAVTAVDYRLTVQRVHWLRPARFDEVLTATPIVEKIGNTSFFVRTRFTVGDELRVEAETTYVRVDADGQKLAFDDGLRARLLAGAPGVVTDHAADPGALSALYRYAIAPVVPWKNGGGVTHELLREPPSDGRGDFALRVSIAEVTADGPFSAFPGVDRVITLLRGPGFTLSREGVSVRIDRPEEPFAFQGEDPWFCRPEGPLFDLNVMTDRATRRAAVVRRPPGRVEGTLLLALAPGRIAGVEVSTWDLARPIGPVASTVATMAVWVS